MAITYAVVHIQYNIKGELAMSLSVICCDSILVGTKCIISCFLYSFNFRTISIIIKKESMVLILDSFRLYSYLHRLFFFSPNLKT